MAQMDSGGRKNIAPATPSTVMMARPIERSSSLNITPEVVARDRITRVQKLSLSTIDLSGLALTTVPPELPQLSLLTRLYLSHNGFENIAPELCAITTLEELDMSHNRLKNIPPVLYKLVNLKRLRLSENLIRFIPSGMVLLTGLRVLNLYGNELSYLPSDIRDMTWLQDLYIGRNNLSSSAQEAKEMQGVEGFVAYSKLTTMRQSGVLTLGFASKIDKVGQTVQKLALVDTNVWAGCSDGTIKVWRAAGGSDVREWKAHDRRIHTLFHDMAGAVVYSAAEDLQLAVWNTKDLSLVTKFKTDALVLCAFSISDEKNKKHIYLGTTSSSVLFGRLRKKENDRYFDMSQRIAVSGGTIISCMEQANAEELWLGSEKQVFVLRLADQSISGSFKAHDRGITAMTIGGKYSEHIWTSSQDSTVRIWDVKSRKLLKAITHPAPIFCMITVRDTVWCGSWDKSIVVRRSYEPWDVLRELTGRHSDAVTTLLEVVKHREVWSGSTSKDNSICIWRWE